MSETTEVKTPDPIPLPERVIRGSFSVNFTINGRGIQMSGYINDGETRADLNRRIDEFQDVITRQHLISHLESREGKKQEAFFALEHNSKRFETLIKRKKSNGGKLPTSLEEELKKFDVTMEAIQRDIAIYEKDIEGTKMRIDELT